MTFSAAVKRVNYNAIDYAEMRRKAKTNKSSKRDLSGSNRLGNTLGQTTQTFYRVNSYKLIRSGTYGEYIL